MKKNYLIALFSIIIFGIFAGGLILNNKKNTSRPTSSNELDIQISGIQITPITSNTNISAGLNLNISQPANNSIVTKSNVKVAGVTQPKADVSINDTDLKADKQGNFSTNIILDEGENTIVIVATDENGNYAEKEITVTYQTPE